MNILYKLFLLSLVFLLAVSCGSNQTSTSLEVSHSFQMTNPNFGGGLLVYGENTTGKKFSIALDASLQTKVPLESGTWTFYAIGWDGSTPNYKFEGTKYCGKSVADVSSSSSTVSINVTTAMCSDVDFVADVAPKMVFTKACGAFYNYSPPTDTYSEVVTFATASSFNCANLPVAYQSEYTHYRVVAFEQISPVPVPRFMSECKSLASGYLDLPTKRFPLAIRAYRNITDCSNKVSDNPFRYANGIEAGGDDFGHKLLTSGSTSYLLIPSSVSRRGISPLMNILPRVLCGTSGSYSDCVSPPVSTTHIHVPWMLQTNTDQQTLAFEGATSCVGVLAGNNKFGVDSCQIDDGQLKAKIYRNELVCQESGLYSNVKDIYQRNGRVFILKQVSINFFVDVLTVDGKFITSYQLPGSNYSGPRVAADNSGNMVVTYFDGSNNKIDKYVFNTGTKTFTSGSSFTHSTSISDVELNEAGTEIYIAYLDYTGTWDYKVMPYTSGGSLGTAIQLGSATSGSNRIQIKSVGSTLFAVTDENTLQKMTIGTLSFSGLNSLTSSGSSMHYIDVTSNKILMMNATGNVFWTDHAGVPVRTSFSATASPVGIAHNTLSLGKVFVATTSGLLYYNLNDTTPVNQAVATSDCTDTVSVSGKMLTFRSMKDDSYEVYNHALELLGTRSLSSEHPRYLFESLNKDHDASGGGILRRAQEHMSSAALGGFLGKYSNTCSGLVTAANAVTGGQITDSIVIFDRKDNKYLTINMKIKKIAETMTNTYFCVPSDPTASTCSNSFDLELVFTITQPDRNEAIKMKIDCDNKIGSFESREIESGTGARTQYNLLEWSTEDMNSARFEEHELGIEGSSVKVSVSKLEKLGTSTDFWARTVNFGFDGSGSYGSTSEMHRISSYIASGNEHLQDGTPSAFFSNSATPVQTARASASLYNLTAGSPTSCMATSTSDLFTANAKASCNLPFNSVTPVTSQGLDLKLDEFSDLSTGVTAVPASSIKGVFTIP